MQRPLLYPWAFAGHGGSPPSFITGRQTSQGNRVSRGTGLLGSTAQRLQEPGPACQKGPVCPQSWLSQSVPSPRCREGPVSQKARGPDTMLQGGDKPEPRGYAPTALGCRERRATAMHTEHFRISSVPGAPNSTLVSMTLPIRKWDCVAPKSMLGPPGMLP